MRVKVQKLNYAGRPMLAKERHKLDPFVGELRIVANRLHRFGRSVTTAELTDVTADTSHIIAELHDVSLLFLEERKMRLRGFEMTDLVEHGQTWDVEVL